MITFFKNTEAVLECLLKPVSGVWVNAVDPTSDEVEQLVEMGIPQDYITYCLDVDERSRTEREDDGTQLILIRIPYYQGEMADVPYITVPLGIVIKDEAIFTIGRFQNDILREFASGRVRGLSTGKRYRFILRLLLATANCYLSYLRTINKKVDILEDQLQASIANKEVLGLLKYQKCLVYFTTALRANQLMLERLQRAQLFHRYPDDEDLLEDVITENQQAIEMVNISNNILSSMMDAFASIISNNLNIVMKFLTSVTIVLSLSTIITSFFGMNVDFPIQEHPLAYMYILLGMVGLSAIVVFIFYRRNWF